MFLHTLLFNPRARVAGAAVLVMTLLIPSLAIADSPSSPFPGLEPVPSKNVGTLYRRPDVDPSAYSKVMIGEPVVEFSKNWNTRNYGTFGLSAAQLNKIRVDLSALAKSTFTQVLSDGGYVIVTDAADGVLYITPNIVNLFINAPATQTAG